MGPVFDARDRVAQLVGRPSLELAAGRLRRGIRRHLLGDDPAPERDGELLADLDALADAGDAPTALIFEAVDAADAGTLSLLARLARHPLRPALVLGFRGEPGPGPARELLDAVLQREGESRVIRAPTSVGAENPRPLDPLLVPAPARLVLRAGAIIGDGFEASLVARLLEISEREVLERLQEAADEGAPLDDLGDGRFRLEATTAEKLRAGVLPSLASGWHRRLAHLLGGEEPARSEVVAPAAAPSPGEGEPGRPAQAAASEPVSDASRVALDAGMVERALSALGRAGMGEDAPQPEDPFAGLAPPQAPEPEPPAAQSGRIRRMPPQDIEDEADPFARLAPEPPEPLTAEVKAPEPPATLESGRDPFDAIGLPGVSEAAPSAQTPPDGAGVTPGADSPRPSLRAVRASVRAARPDVPRPRGIAVPGRSAQHLAAAGEAEAAVPRFLAAAREATSEGAYGTAETYVERALALIGLLPDTSLRRQLRARAHAELARVHWEGSGPQGFTLAVALQEAETALGLADEVGEPAARAEIRALIAAICYDIGDAASLERALAELTAATRELLDAGDARGAARLLNDQAAVWVRLGDPVRAVHLLEESRRVFVGLADMGREDRLELAETDHLLARLPLHVNARPGREVEALASAVAHAEEAATTYEALNERRELARVWETLGRLELRRGSLERAWGHLQAAFQVQRALGDAVGLARSAAGLSDVLAKAGRVDEAFQSLADSIQLNAIKGSPLGLAANREALETLRSSMSAEMRRERQAEIHALGALLEEAAARLS